jgi:hypothetical protein
MRKLTLRQVKEEFDVDNAGAYELVASGRLSTVRGDDPDQPDRVTFIDHLG